MSPFLFLLVAKGLSRLIMEARRDAVIKGIRVVALVYISHLLFVDDIQLFGQGSPREIREYRTLLDTYCGATCMEVVTTQIVFNDKSLNPQGTTQGATIRTVTNVTLITYPLHFRLPLLRLKGGIPRRIY